MIKRPKGLVVIAIIVFIAAILALIVGISIFIPDTPLNIIWTLKNSFPLGFKSSITGMIFGLFILILGLIMVYAGWGLLKGKKWAWWAVLIIFFINGIGEAVSLINGAKIDGVSGLVIMIIFILYLTRPRVRKFYGISLKNHKT